MTDAPDRRNRPPRGGEMKDLAKDLTKTQREYLAEPPGKRHAGRGSTRKALERRGLVDQRGGAVRPTPLGRLVALIAKRKRRPK